MKAKDFFERFKEFLKEENEWEYNGEKRTYLEVYQQDEPSFTYLVNKKLYIRL